MSTRQHILPIFGPEAYRRGDIRIQLTCPVGSPDDGKTTFGRSSKNGRRREQVGGKEALKEFKWR